MPRRVVSVLCLLPKVSTELHIAVPIQRDSTCRIIGFVGSGTGHLCSVKLVTVSGIGKGRVSFIGCAVKPNKQELVVGLPREFARTVVVGNAGIFLRYRGVNGNRFSRFFHFFLGSGMIISCVQLANSRARSAKIDSLSFMFFIRT